MIGKKRTTNYLSNENLIREIMESKAVQKKYPKRTPARCLTKELVNMLMLLVNKYSQKHNWRGYSYIDDMKSEALVSLCQSALKFDPEKSQNPFGYYTQIITRCFLTYLDKEKNQRMIRDELIEASGSDLKPSTSRQMESDDYVPGFNTYETTPASKAPETDKKSSKKS